MPKRRPKIEASIFVQWSQSNGRASGVGAVPAVFRTPDPGVFIWNTVAQQIEVYQAGVNSDTVNGGMPQKWGPEAEFSRQHRAVYPDTPMYWLKYAPGGTQLGATPGDDWLPSEHELFDTVTVELGALKAALVAQGYTPRTKLIKGIHGEADAGRQDGGIMAAAYGPNRTKLYAAQRAQWGDQDTRFVDARISKHAPSLTYAAAVREGQLIAAANEQDAQLITLDDLALGPDLLHYGTGSIREIGRRGFEAYDGRYFTATPDPR